MWGLCYSHTGTQIKFDLKAGPDFSLLLGFMERTASIGRIKNGFYKWNHSELQISLQTFTHGLWYIQREREREQSECFPSEP